MSNGFKTMSEAESTDGERTDDDKYGSVTMRPGDATARRIDEIDDDSRHLSHNGAQCGARRYEETDYSPRDAEKPNGPTSSQGRDSAQKQLRRKERELREQKEGLQRWKESWREQQKRILRNYPNSFSG